MEILTFRECLAFDTSLALGQRVSITWTACYRIYTATAIIAKLNPKSILAAIDHEICGSNHLACTGVLYPKGAVIRVARFVDGRRWTANNCVLPVEQE